MTGPCHKGPVENHAISTAAQAIQRTASEPVNVTVYLPERMERMLVLLTRVTRESRAIEVNKGGVFVGSIRLTRVTRDALFAKGGAGNLRVETLSLEFGHQLLAVFGKGFLLLFDVQPAAEARLDQLVCNAVSHSLHHLALLSEGAGAFHFPGLLDRAAIAAARVGAVCESRAIDIEEQAAWMLEAHESRLGIGANAEEPVWRGYAGADGIGDHAVALSWEGAGSMNMRERSGRSSCRDIPVMRSTSRTRSSGTFFHCEMAWEEMLSISLARRDGPKPALRKRSMGSLMPPLKAFLSHNRKHFFQCMKGGLSPYSGS